jgi:CubicO group peptidase (beta-lactamase class C family)
VTRQFRVASILVLEERGKLKVADAIKKYLPGAPAAWEKVTIFHLLTPASGMPNFSSFPDYPKLEPFAATAEEVVARFRDKSPGLDPGDK